jgi:hypothetical protein
VQVHAALLGALPVRGDAFVLVRLVDDLGNQLRALVDGARVWRRELATEDGVLAAGGDQQAEQGPHAVHCEAEDDDGDEHEDGDAALHGGRAGFCAALQSPFRWRCSVVIRGETSVAGAGWEEDKGVFGRDSGDHGEAVSCIVPRRPSAEEERAEE